MHLQSNHVRFKPYTGYHALSFCEAFLGATFREVYDAFTIKQCAFQTLYRISCSFILQTIFGSSFPVDI